MIVASDPNKLIAELAIGGMVALLFWRVIVWVREAPAQPDPWDAETDKKLSEPETTQACHHCSTPQNSSDWFCPHCGSAVGTYNNLMPYVMIFSEGEVLRNGIHQRFRNRPLVITGFALMALGMNPFLIPVLVILLVRTLRGPKQPAADKI
jgi:hypothetical protein